MLDERLLAEAMALNEAGQVDEAIERLNSIIASTDDPAEKAIVTLDKSSYYSAHGNLGKAREELEKGLSLAPNDPLALIMYEFGDACLCEREGKPAEYHAKLNKILASHPELRAEPRLRFLYEDIQRLLGIELSRLGKTKEAIPLLEESLSYDLSSTEKSYVLCHLGVCYEDALEYESAREKLAQAIDLGLNKEWTVAAHSYLGICYYHLGRMVDSKNEFLLCEAAGGGPGAPLTNVYAWLRAVCAALGQRTESEQYARLSKPM